MAPPDCTSPVVSTATGGAVAAPYIRTSKAVIEIAGSNDRKNWTATDRRGRPGMLRPRYRPASALGWVALSCCESGGSGTWRSLSLSGGAR
jgi:hypothetical protein